jgi:hypothetical protein
MNMIFINYRRDDSIIYAGRLFDRLIAHFGASAVFMDIESINVGDDWVQKIETTLISCILMIVVIGPDWLTILQERLKDQTVDQVRFEIAQALVRQLLIVPVLVSNATMPNEHDLPDDLKPLCRRQAITLNDMRFSYDVSYLITELSRFGHSKLELRHISNINVDVPLSAAGIEDVLSWGWSGDKLLDVLLSVDYQTLEGLTADYVGSVEQWAPIVMNNPDTWRLLIDRPQSIVGNWHFVPLFTEDYERARNGLLRERDISADRVPYMDLPGWYDIHFLAIFLLPRFRQVHNLLLLRRSMLDHFTMLARQRVFIRRICANAYTPAGEALCRSFEFVPGVKHVDHGRMYERTVYPLPSSELFREYSELERRYAEAMK